MTDIGRDASLVFLLFFACCVFYFCLTFVCPFCVFYHAPLCFYTSSSIFCPEAKMHLCKGRKTFFCFSFQLQGKAPTCIDWGQFLALLSNSIFPVRQDFDKYLFTFLFLKHRNIFKSRWLFAFPIPVDKEGHLKICVVSVDIAPHHPPHTPPPYLRTLQIL